ncbi:MAG TPA: glycosyltransferase [Pyrinomonadaceae bacterium]
MRAALISNGFSATSLGIVCPMANEEASAVSFVNRVLDECAAFDFSRVTFFAILDSACRDRTRGLLEELKSTRRELNVIWAPENRCAVDAYVRGYREALNAGCDWILEIDAGFSHQPENIPLFFEKMREGYDCVFGSRFCEGGHIADSSQKRNILSRGGTLLTNALMGTKLKDMTSGFQMFSRAALEHVLAKGIQSRGHFFQTEMKIHCRNLRTVEVPIHYRAASASVNQRVIKDSLKNLWRLYRLKRQGRA